MQQQGTQRTNLRACACSWQREVPQLSWPLTLAAWATLRASTPNNAQQRARLPVIMFVQS